MTPRLLLCAAALALHPLAAVAQPLADPTRPPPRYYAPAGDPATVPAAAQAQAQAQALPQLQSVLIARHPGGRHVAVIDGQTVRLGDQFKGARVAQMTQTEVVLVDGKSRRVLRLYPPAPPPQRHNERD
ncbi:hypothetical protein PO883_24330 [Massilia sp. DJPM01]|uniref:hypothetical protein n=1 Tax=Massilia sp. DJPM01 TaxID=3024404 RepID=UPI00259F3D05|nr:hypothetical protein [Massilia sp. DJPM01]MDM5180313.1 hypothetical protein [Massilia sp. DJPM01]